MECFLNFFNQYMEGLSFFSHSLIANVMDEGLFNEHRKSVSRLKYAICKQRGLWYNGFICCFIVICISSNGSHIIFAICQHNSIWNTVYCNDLFHSFKKIVFFASCTGVKEILGSKVLGSRASVSALFRPGRRSEAETEVSRACSRKFWPKDILEPCTGVK